ncbi:MAG: nucleoside transporter C-terminal domain-containing protein [Verrucomicrobiota bacterium]
MDWLTHLLRGCIGLAILTSIGFVLSQNRKAIDWPTIAKGIAIQGLLAAILLKIAGASEAVRFLASAMIRMLDWSNAGSSALFGKVASDQSLGGILAFQVLPSIIFFGALATLLYHWGVLPFFVRAGAWILRRIMPISGPESLGLASNVFVGPIESTLTIKPYLQEMTRSELFCLMTAGMSTIAGGVMVAYIAILGGGSDEMRIEFGRQLITASLLSAPAAIVAAKLLIPETHKVDLNPAPDLKMRFENAFDALTVGTNEGLKLALAVGAILIVFIALVTGINDLANVFGKWTGLNEVINQSTDGRYQSLSLQFLFGLMFSPIAWAIGIDSSNLLAGGQLLGEKTALNEFIAYNSLGTMIQSGQIADPQQIAILTFALCGFANFASMGIMLGGLYALVPSRRAEIARLGLPSIVSGTVASLMTACWAGALY